MERFIMKRIATVLAAGALALFAGSLVISEPDYGGPTMRLPPGQYANLEGWDKQISSFMCTQEE